MKSLKGKGEVYLIEGPNGKNYVGKAHCYRGAKQIHKVGAEKRFVEHKKHAAKGDEIANSTESTSGLAIVATAIRRLSDAKAKFVFATHLHQLAKMDFVRSLTSLRCDPGGRPHFPENTYHTTSHHRYC